MVHCLKAHFLSDLLTKGDQSNSNDSGQLINLLSLVLVLGTNVKQLLNVDFFLMDNVESLTNSPTAQEKLYHIYNQMMEKGGKLAFTAGLPPDRNSAMESYLTSRFQWGMVAEIKPIDDSTTAKIILKLAKDINLTIPESIIHFLLSRIARDFISIQNAVSSINQESYIQKKKVTLPLVKAALDLS